MPSEERWATPPLPPHPPSLSPSPGKDYAVGREVCPPTHPLSLKPSPEERTRPSAEKCRPPALHINSHQQTHALPAPCLASPPSGPPSIPLPPPPLGGAARQDHLQRRLGPVQAHRGGAARRLPKEGRRRRVCIPGEHSIPQTTSHVHLPVEQSTGRRGGPSTNGKDSRCTRLLHSQPTLQPTTLADVDGSGAPPPPETFPPSATAASLDQDAQIGGVYGRGMHRRGLQPFTIAQPLPWQSRSPAPALTRRPSVENAPASPRPVQPAPAT